MVNYKCEICKKSSTKKSLFRYGFDAEIWTNSNIQREIMRLRLNLQEKSCICTGCHAFCRNRHARAGSIDLGQRIKIVVPVVEEFHYEEPQEPLIPEMETSEVRSEYSQENQILPESQDASDEIVIENQRRHEDQHRSVVVDGIPSAIRSQSKCFVCFKKVRTRISKIAIVDVFLKTGIIVDDNNRCCREHFDGPTLLDDALAQINPSSNDTIMTGKQVKKWMISLRSLHQNKHLPIDFEVNDYSEDVFHLLLGVSKNNYEVLVDHCAYKIRNSQNRSVRNGLAMFLIKMRLGISQKVIAFLFGIRHQPVVHRAIHSVREALVRSFVPKYHGFVHISRETLIQNHSRKFFHSILGVKPESLVLILDGTYLYTEKPTQIYLQQRTFSTHKGRNLFKPMMTVSPDGYILEASGLYFGDCGNNDANILKHMMHEAEGIMSVLLEGDALILDRGFRDAISELTDNGIVAFVPKFLKKGQDQFTTSEANESRQVTMLRFVVEMANGRLKQKFRFFQNLIPASYFPALNDFLKICIAILNAFSPPLFTESEWHEELFELYIKRAEQSNHLQEQVKQMKLDGKSKAPWKEANENDLLEFPSLSIQQLKTLTLGPFQLRVGRLYNENHAPDSSAYNYVVHKTEINIIRVSLSSRMRSSKFRKVWIKYEPHKNEPDGILGWYCLCPNGARTLGCCGHVAAVLRFLCYDRLNPSLSRKNLNRGFLDAQPERAPQTNGPNCVAQQIADALELVWEDSDEEPSDSELQDDSQDYYAIE